MKSLQALSVLACLCAGFAVDCAAQYPARAIRIIVPVPPGASLDTLARTVGARLSARVGQTVLIENQPGGAWGRVDCRGSFWSARESEKTAS